MSESVPAIMEELERLGFTQALEWLRAGRPRPDQKAIIVNSEGDAVAVLLSPQEYEAMVAFINLANDPKRLAEHRARVQRIREGHTLPGRHLR